MAVHDLVFFLNAFIRVQSVKIRGLIIWLQLCRAVQILILIWHPAPTNQFGREHIERHRIKQQ